MFVFRQALDTKPLPERRSLFAYSDPDISSEWVYDFLRRYDWVVSIETSYLRDDFNLFGLSSLVEDYTNAMRIILGNYFEPCTSKSLPKQTCHLYALIHARYLLTATGAQKMKDKFEKRKFGVCPRAFCHSQALLPIGLDPMPGKGRVMTYCPCCRDLYDPGVELDGAFFGPSFPHFFVQAVDLAVSFEPCVPTPLTVFGVPVTTSSRCVHSLPDA